MFKIIDNFIDMGDLAVLKAVLESNDFPWYFQKVSVKGSSDKLDCHFGHNFYLNDNVSSDSIKLLNPIIEKLKVNSLIRIKGNLNPITPKPFNSKPHKDQAFDCKVALYYLNTNNGYTVINDEQIKCVKNRIVLFNSSVEHYGVTCTDEPTKLAINFNYV